VYDMYPWNGAPAAKAPTASRAPKTAPVPPATTAVQVALDRRDNGGDAAAEPTAVLARR
jgi:hypothetical protein